MIVVCGGIKGGGGKTTLATNLAVMRSLAGYDILLVDADEQDSASDFTVLRNQLFEPTGGAGYTAIKLRGQALVVQKSPKRLMHGESHDEIGVTEEGMT